METKGVFERSLQTGPSYVLVLLNVSFPSLRDVCSTYILEPSCCRVLIRNFLVQNGQNITCTKSVNGRSNWISIFPAISESRSP